MRVDKDRYGQCLEIRLLTMGLERVLEVADGCLIKAGLIAVRGD